MTFEELKRRLMLALDNPNTGNRLALSMAVNDYEDAKNERIEELEAFAHKLAISPRAPQWVVDEAREVCGESDPPDRGDAWTGGICENH